MTNTSKRGFASMDNDKQRTIASKGGKAAHIKGTAHEWSSAEARAAGRKGGESRGSRSRTIEASSTSGPANFVGEPNWVAESGSSLRNPNEYANNNGVRVPNSNSNHYPNAIPVGQDHIAPGFRTNSAALVDSRVN
jgi:general stress protein YciG